MQTIPHAADVADVLALLDTTDLGLSATEAAARIRRHGPNRLREQPGIAAWQLVLDEVRNPLVLILLGAAFALGIVTALDPSENLWGDAGLIVAIVVLNAALGFVQNLRAQRGIEALQRLASPDVQVLRDGSPQTRPAHELVPGDVVMVEEGDRVAADGRLLQALELRTDEASITGESMPVEKSVEPVDPETPLAERSDMAYLGSSVLAGRGRYVVTATGMQTEVGAIAQAVQSVQDGPTPFQREVAELARRITAAIAVLIVLIAILQLTVGGQDLLETFVTAVALAVAAIPEGLPVVMTLALAFGTRRMLERHSLVRSLPVVEIVGSAEVICTDKTGTITEGRMSLRRLELPQQSLQVVGSATEPNGAFQADGNAADLHDEPALLAAALCNNAHHVNGSFGGDPTEVALLIGALKADIVRDRWERLEEIPFSSARKLMSVVVDGPGGRQVFAKGALEVVLERCTRVKVGDGIRPLTSDDRDRIRETNDRLAADAFRVLALAGKPGDPGHREEAERDLVYYGLAALADPPREAAGPALRATSDAGIRVVMITGDNAGTATAIGRDIGLAGDAVAGSQLEALSDDEIVERGTIFARVEPRHKLRILEAFRRHGMVVVMTGDGVNDAPALKGADVGIAMGLRGTDVARDASDIVLLDDNFATIVAAIEEGRRIAGNIKKFLNYLLTGNLAEVLVDPRRIARRLPANHRRPDPVGQPGHRQRACAGAGRGPGAARYHARAASSRPDHRSGHAGPGSGRGRADCGHRAHHLLREQRALRDRDGEDRDLHRARHPGVPAAGRDPPARACAAARQPLAVAGRGGQPGAAAAVDLLAVRRALRRSAAGPGGVGHHRRRAGCGAARSLGHHLAGAALVRTAVTQRRWAARPARRVELVLQRLEPLLRFLDRLIAALPVALPRKL